MGFQIHKRDTIEFEVENVIVKLVVQRMSAKIEMLINNTISRLQEKHGDRWTATEDFVELYAGVLADIVVSWEGVDDVELPEAADEKKELFVACGTEFLINAIVAYNKSKEVVDPKS
jgi:hypothetical protein